MDGSDVPRKRERCVKSVRRGSRRTCQKASRPPDPHGCHRSEYDSSTDRHNEFNLREALLV
eukprot:6204924-Pleurochrysis_carterae.AAC.2